MDGVRKASQFAPKALAFLRAHGHETADLCRRYGLPPDTHTQSHVAITWPDARMLYDEVAERLQDPHFGLRVGLVGFGGVYGNNQNVQILEYAVRSAASLEQAVRQGVRYHKLMDPDRRITTVTEPDGLAVHLSFMSDPIAGGRHLNEFTIGGIVAIARTNLETEPPAFPRIWFASEPPPSLDFLKANLGERTAFLFGAATTGIVFPTEALGLSPIHRDQALSRLLDDLAERALGKVSSERGRHGELKRRIRDAIPKEIPTLASVARDLRTSVRTLQRRLSSEGLSFEGVLDEVRRDIALTLVERREVSLAEVAFSCGYSKPQAFVRAFKRWTGATPTAFRAASSTERAEDDRGNASRSR